MAFDYEILTEIRTLTTSAGDTPPFVNPTDKKSYIRTIILFNYHATLPSMVKLYNVPDSAGSVGAAAASNQFFGSNVTGETNINPGQTIVLEFAAPGIILKDVNSSIRGSSSVASAVNIQMFGGQEDL